MSMRRHERNADCSFGVRVYSKTLSLWIPDMLFGFGLVKWRQDLLGSDVM
jgi:hypothetical protein